MTCNSRETKGIRHSYSVGVCIIFNREFSWIFGVKMCDLNKEDFSVRWFTWWVFTNFMFFTSISDKEKDLFVDKRADISQVYFVFRSKRAFFNTLSGRLPHIVLLNCYEIVLVIGLSRYWERIVLCLTVLNLQFSRMVFTWDSTVYTGGLK